MGSSRSSEVRLVMSADANRLAQQTASGVIAPPSEIPIFIQPFADCLRHRHLDAGLERHSRLARRLAQ